MKIRMIYLAAGNSRRFGSNKLLYKIDGKPMYLYGLETLQQVLENLEETTLTVVTEFSEIQEYVKDRQKDFPGRMDLVGSPDREKGISWSLKAGLSLGEADYYLFSVADQPWIRSDTIVRLIGKTIKEGCRGGYVKWQHTSGNPAIFSNELRPRLMALEGDTGGKKILCQEQKICTVEALEPEELRDIDEERRI